MTNAALEGFSCLISYARKSQGQTARRSELFVKRNRQIKKGQIDYQTIKRHKQPHKKDGQTEK